MVLTRVLLSAITVVALIVPPANAEPLTFDCGFDGVGQETLTGGQDTFTGLASGYVVGSAPTNSVSISCWIRVDGTRVASTPTGTGTSVATTTGQLTFTASDTQDVDLCADWTDGSTSGTSCFEFCPVCIFLPSGVFCFWAPCSPVGVDG